MIPVEVRVHGESVLNEKMTSMREWLDHRRFEPSGFRYTISSSGILFRVDFSVTAEARAFADAFDGKIVGEFSGSSTQAA